MPTKATKSVENQSQELRQVAAKRLILVVLDGLFWFCVAKIISRFYLSDMWDVEHERPFSCIDPATASKLLVVRRSDGEPDILLC